VALHRICTEITAAMSHFAPGELSLRSRNRVRTRHAVRVLRAGQTGLLLCPDIAAALSSLPPLRKSSSHEGAPAHSSSGLIATRTLRRSSGAASSPRQARERLLQKHARSTRGVGAPTHARQPRYHGRGVRAAAPARLTERARARRTSPQRDRAPWRPSHGWQQPVRERPRAKARAEITLAA
jgi:hypothetical protein